jgi:hypothetical protein
MTVDWRAYPPRLRAEHVAELYGYTVNTVRKLWQKRSQKIPTPCASRPYMVRRDDCKRHWERTVA